MDYGTWRTPSQREEAVETSKQTVMKDSHNEQITLTLSTLIGQMRPSDVITLFRYLSTEYSSLNC